MNVPESVLRQVLLASRKGSSDCIALFDKYVDRYPKDHEFRRLAALYESAFEDEDVQLKEYVVKRLNELIDIGSVKGEGGQALALKDRRKKEG